MPYLLFIELTTEFLNKESENEKVHHLSDFGFHDWLLWTSCLCKEDWKCCGFCLAWNWKCHWIGSSVMLKQIKSEDREFQKILDIQFDRKMNPKKYEKIDAKIRERNRILESMYGKGF